MKTIYFIAQRNLPLSLFPHLIGLQKVNEAPKLQTGTYSSHECVTEMLDSIASTIDTKINNAIGTSSFIGLMTDESIDIAVLKRLIIYVQVVQGGTSEVDFGEHVGVIDGKANTIVEALPNFLEAHLGLYSLRSK